MVTFYSNGELLQGEIRRKMDSLPYYLVESNNKRYILLESELQNIKDGKRGEGFENDSSGENVQKKKKRGRPRKTPLVG